MNLIAGEAELVFRNGQSVQTDSRRVAKAFGKAHRNVIKAIENLECSPEFAKLNFELCYEISELQNGKPLKFYQITEQGAMLLIMGFTGRQAAKVKEAFITAFARMREQLRRYEQYCSLYALHDAEQAQASECGRGLNAWKRRKRFYDARLPELRQQIQISLFPTV